MDRLRSAPGYAVAVWNHRIGGPVVKLVLAAVAILFASFRIFDVSRGVVFNGLAVGTLYGILGVGIILIYRTNRIINFAAAALGAVPGVLAALLLVITWSHIPWAWYVCLPIAVLGGALLGGVADVIVIRRFGSAPRLILTVATIGLAQLLAFFSLMIPIWLGSEGRPISFVPTPFKSERFRFSIGNSPFTGDHPFTIAAVIVVVLALAAFLRYTRMGIALRASAENADRASLLGIPVKRVQTVAWVLAGALAGATIFFRAAIVGVPTDGSLGPKVLLFALTAAVVARMESIPVALVAGMAVGILGEASVVYAGKDSLASAIMLVVILGALMAQRGKLSRAYDTGVSSWRAVKEFRPIPLELTRLREVQALRWGSLGLVGLVAFLAPHLPFIRDGGNLPFLQLVVISSIIVVSLVILTGWAGQISLGQFGIVGIGATVAGKLAADFNQDFFVTLVAGVLAGAAVAVLIGLPALRIPGLYLAVATLAFGAAVQFYFLDDSYRIGQILRPDRANRIELPVLWERITLEGVNGPGIAFYYLCLGFLVLTLLAARAYRRNRAGRVLMAVRENTRAASSYAVNPARTKLAAFAVAGAIAALGGVLMAYFNGSIDAGTYSIQASIYIFIIAVIGGLTSLTGAVVGAVVIESIRLMGGQLLSGIEVLVTGVGLLVVLMVIPGGFAEVIYETRDKFLRWVAKRHDLHVPSLVADKLVRGDEAEGLLEEAERTAVESGESFEAVLGARGGER